MNVKKTVWIGHDGNVREELDKKPTLAQMQEWVGGYVERTIVRWEDRQCSMYVNEDGHSLRLPYNARATALLAIANTRPDSLGHIFGSVLNEAGIGTPVHAVVGNVVLVIGWRNW